jgi:hypothetical protein
MLVAAVQSFSISASPKDYKLCTFNKIKQKSGNYELFDYVSSFISHQKKTKNNIKKYG